MNQLIKLFDVAPLNFQGALVMLVLFAVLGRYAFEIYLTWNR